MDIERLFSELNFQDLFVFAIFLATFSLLYNLWYLARRLKQRRRSQKEKEVLAEATQSVESAPPRKGKRLNRFLAYKPGIDKVWRA